MSGFLKKTLMEWKQELTQKTVVRNQLSKEVYKLRGMIKTMERYLKNRGD